MSTLTNSPNDADGLQADHLRRVAAGMQSAPPTADRVAVVFGAKGGVGTSAVALAIARDLAASTKATGVAALVVDAHAGRNDLAVMSAEGEDTPGLALTTAAKLGIPAPSGQGAAVTEAAKRLLRAARLWTDDQGGWIVIDAGVGDTLWARELAARAMRPLLVTTPDQLATVNAYVALKRLGLAASRVGLILNHCQDDAQAEQSHARLANSCRQFLDKSSSLAGWLPTLSEDPTAATVMAAAA
ncbi:MAG: hypothetical protein AAF266_00905 [Planctomycetota bacterium]